MSAACPLDPNFTTRPLLLPTLWVMKCKSAASCFAASTSTGPFFPSPSFGGLTRLHSIETHPHLERIANIATDAPEGFRGVNSFEFGPFIVGMNFNHSAAKTFALPAAAVGKPARDLVGNTEYDALPERIDLAPAATGALYLAS